MDKVSAANRTAPPRQQLRRPRRRRDVLSARRASSRPSSGRSSTSPSSPPADERTRRDCHRACERTAKPHRGRAGGCEPSTATPRRSQDDLRHQRRPRDQDPADSPPSPPTRDARRTGTRTNNATDQRRPQGEARRRTTNSIPGLYRRCGAGQRSNSKGAAHSTTSKGDGDSSGTSREGVKRAGAGVLRIRPSPALAIVLPDRQSAAAVQRVAGPQPSQRGIAERVCWSTPYRGLPIAPMPRHIGSVWPSDAPAQTDTVVRQRWRTTRDGEKHGWPADRVLSFFVVTLK